MRFEKEPTNNIPAESPVRERISVVNPHDGFMILSSMILSSLCLVLAEGPIAKISERPGSTPRKIWEL